MPNAKAYAKEDAKNVNESILNIFIYSILIILEVEYNNLIEVLEVQVNCACFCLYEYELLKTCTNVAYQEMLLQILRSLAQK